MTNRIQYLLLFFLLRFHLVAQTQLPEGFYDETVATNLDQYVGVVFDGNGQGYVWRRTGHVYLLDTTGTLLPDPIIDLSEEVAFWWDMGMLGFALDPKFLENGKAYLLYVMDRHHLLHHGTPEYDPTTTIKDEATIGRITRLTLDKATGFKTVVPGSRKVLLGATKETGFPLLFKTHGTGSLAFGTDGTLLASCGDTGHPEWADAGSSAQTYHAQAIADGMMREAENVGAFRSQLVNSLSGKIIRIDPETGEGLASNPFYDPTDPHAPRSKVWSLGLRNPYRFVVKPNSGSHFPGDGKPGDLMIGDVGSTLWEELNIADRGGQNFGWPLYEGFVESMDYLNHRTRNRDAPNPLHGTAAGCDEPFFLFSDLVAPPFLHTDGLFKNPCDTSQQIPGNVPVFLHTPPAMAYRNNNGNLFPEVFFPSYDGSGAPIGLSINDPAAGVSGAPFVGITALGGCFYQGNVFPKTYHGKYFVPDYKGWIRVMDMDENNRIASIEMFHPSAPNIVSLSENPKDGCLYYMDFKNKRLHKICYGGSPSPVAHAVADRHYGPSPLSVHFDASGSFSPANAPLSYHWDFGDGTFSSDPAPDHLFVAPDDKPFFFQVTLTVTDTAGKSAFSELAISLNNTPPRVEITSLPDTAHYSLDRTTLLQLLGTASDDEHSPGELSFEWRTYLHHDEHDHTDLIDRARESRFFISPLGCQDDAYWYRVELNVTDAAGLSGQAVSLLFPHCGQSLLEGTYFTAEKHDRTVLLKWGDFSGQEIHRFEVERGSSVFDFKPIADIGTGATGLYSFRDFHPVPSANFYRLKIWDKGNVFSVTPPVLVDFTVEGTDVLLYPNPAKDQFALSIKKLAADELTLKIYNAHGALVLRKQWAATAGMYFNETIQVPGLAQGVYFYEMENGETKHRGALKIVR